MLLQRNLRRLAEITKSAPLAASKRIYWNCMLKRRQIIARLLQTKRELNRNVATMHISSKTIGPIRDLVRKIQGTTADETLVTCSNYQVNANSWTFVKVQLDNNTKLYWSLYARMEARWKGQAIRMTSLQSQVKMILCSKMIETSRPL